MSSIRLAQAIQHVEVDAAGNIIGLYGPNKTLIRLGSGIIAKNGTQYVHTGTLDETAMAAHTIKGGTIGKSDVLRVNMLISKPATTSVIAFRVRFGGTEMASASLGTGANLVKMQADIFVTADGMQQKGFLGSIIAQSSFGTTSNAMPVANNNTSNDILLTITAALGTISDSVRLEHYSIERL